MRTFAPKFQMKKITQERRVFFACHFNIIQVRHLKSCTFTFALFPLAHSVHLTSVRTNEMQLFFTSDFNELWSRKLRMCWVLMRRSVCLKCNLYLTLRRRNLVFFSKQCKDPLFRFLKSEGLAKNMMEHKDLNQCAVRNSTESIKLRANLRD